MSDIDIRLQIAEGLNKLNLLLTEVIDYQRFLMYCVVFWAMAGIFATKIDRENFGVFLICVTILAVVGFATWHIKHYYVRRNQESSRLIDG